MNVREIEVRLATSKSSAIAHVEIEGTEYILTAGGLSRSVTVYAGRWIRDSRSVGRTFWKPEDLANHYKKHGQLLVDYAISLGAWGAGRLQVVGEWGLTSR